MNNRLVKDTKADRVFMGFNYIFVILSVAIVLYPLIYIISASISDPQAVNSGEMWLFPKGVTFEGYKTILQNDSIWRGYLNTIYYTALGTTINLVVTLPAAYALSRPDFYGHKTFTSFMLVTMSHNITANIMDPSFRPQLCVSLYHIFRPAFPALMLLFFCLLILNHLELFLKLVSTQIS